MHAFHAAAAAAAAAAIVRHRTVAERAAVVFRRNRGTKATICNQGVVVVVVAAAAVVMVDARVAAVGAGVPRRGWGHCPWACVGACVLVQAPRRACTGTRGDGGGRDAGGMGDTAHAVAGGKWHWLKRIVAHRRTRARRWQRTCSGSAGGSNCSSRSSSSKSASGCVGVAMVTTILDS